MDASEIESILNSSLQRCMQNRQFMTIFYERFINSAPEIKHLFKNTDMEKQFEMMGKSLYAMISASEANWQNDQELIDLSRKHREMNINPAYFELWENSLLSTIKECDPSFDENVSNSWKVMIKRGKDLMQRDL